MLSLYAKKGCGGYEKYIDKEIDIPNCNICLKCKEKIFNINDTYLDQDFCKINLLFWKKEEMKTFRILENYLYFFKNINIQIIFYFTNF